MSATETQRSSKGAHVRTRIRKGRGRSRLSRSWRRFYIQLHAPVATEMRCGPTCIWETCEYPVPCLSSRMHVWIVADAWIKFGICVRFMSHDKLGLWQLGITHVLNASHGKLCCKGSDDFYGTTVKYYGVPANDLPTFDLSPFFYPAAEFIHQALTSGGTTSWHASRWWHYIETPCIIFVCVLCVFQERCLSTVLWVWVAQLRWSWPTWWFITTSASCPLRAVCNKNAGFSQTEASCDSL